MGKKDFCCAYGCSHERSKGATCYFYEFPTEQLWRAKWINALKRDILVDGKKKKWSPSDYTKLCSCHFEHPPNPRSRRPQVKHVIPTLFSFTTPPTRRSTSKSLNRSVSPPKRKAACRRKLCDKESQGTSQVAPSSPNPAANASEGLVSQEPGQRDDKDFLLDHDYSHTERKGKLAETVDRLTNQHPDFAVFLADYKDAHEKAEKFESMCESGQILTLETIKEKADLFQYYTGLPSHDVFISLLTYLRPKAIDMKYPRGGKTHQHKHFVHSFKSKPGKGRALSPEEEFFATLVRLRLGIPSKDIARHFGIPQSSFSSIFRAWSALIAIELEQICRMPSSSATRRNQPGCFSGFECVRVVIDCTELFSQTPSSLSANKQLFSNYKHHSTVKFLVGISPSGAVIYISRMYGGRASDNVITKESDEFLNSLTQGDAVMADRGFTIESALPLGVKLIIPSFKPRHKSQFSKEQIQHSKKIAEARIHVERAMRRIKQFMLLAQEVKLAMIDNYETIFKACAYLVNFQKPFVKVT